MNYSGGIKDGEHLNMTEKINTFAVSL